MKKKIFLVLGTFIAICCFSILLLQSKQETKPLSTLALANIEALASGEGENNNYDCPGGGEECVRVSVGNEVHIFYKKETGTPSENNSINF